MATSQDEDREAAREILRERAFAFVEQVEAERDAALKRERELADRLTAALHFRRLAEDEADSLRQAIATLTQDYGGDLLEGLDGVAEGAVVLRKAAEGALVNLEGVQTAAPVSNLRAARRNLKEGLEQWSRMAKKAT